MINGTDGFNLEFAPGYLKATLIISLLSVWVLVGLFAYLNKYTQRRYFTLWTGAWLFYAVWLTLNIGMGSHHDGPVLATAKLWCISASAVCLLWGSSLFHAEKPKQIVLGLFTAFLLVWSYAGATQLNSAILFQAPVFALIGAASFITSWTFYKFRKRRSYVGAGLLVAGFALWGAYLVSYPWMQLADQLVSSAFVIATVVQLFIAVSMIILVLEEARTSHESAFRQIQSQQSAAAVLQRKVDTTEERYRRLFEQALEGIIVASADQMQIIEMNQAAQQLLGVTLARPKNACIRDFLQSADPKNPMPAENDQWFTWVHQQHHLTLVRHDGGTRQVEVAGAKVEVDGKPVFQFFVRELTERARLEQQLRQAERLSAIGQMISGIAHELNNPLAAVQGYLELVLQRHELNPQTRADLEKVARESRRAVKLVKNFLSLAREQPENRQAVDFNQTIRKVLEQRAAEFRVTGMELLLDLDPKLPKTVADAEKVEQVLGILTHNAIQAMMDTPASACLKVSTCVNGKSLTIKVADTGPGVPPAIQARIFEPFFTTKEVGAGTGLGLSIAHGIMNEHRGSIRLEPTETGACFALDFPLLDTTGVPALRERISEPEFDSRVISKSPAPSQPATPAKNTPRILVLDDEKAIAEMLGEMLGLLGYRIAVCNSGPQALAQLETGDFDVVLSDFRMPGMNGREFYEAAFQKHPAISRKIIFLTGDVVNEDTRSFLDSIKAPYLGKPFHLDKVEETVSTLLKRAGNQSPAAN